MELRVWEGFELRRLNWLGKGAFPVKPSGLPWKQGNGNESISFLQRSAHWAHPEDDCSRKTAQTCHMALGRGGHWKRDHLQPAEIIKHVLF